MTNHYTDVCEETIKSLRQQLEQAHADIAGLHDQLEEPQIAQDDYRLNKLELEQLRKQLAELLDWQQKAFAAHPNINIDIDRLKGGN